MNFGVTMFATDYSVAPGEAARMAEQRGFESFFFPEHAVEGRGLPRAPARRPGRDRLPGGLSCGVTCQ